MVMDFSDIPVPYEDFGKWAVILITLELFFWSFVGLKSIKLFKNLIGKNKK
tara:strand:- start:931 stop:1083 length:153 start_codon:yes stop_codon:yes gene_type:complete